MSVPIPRTPTPSLDISPTAQGVDHRRVQKELGDVVVNMHNPVVLSSTSVQVTWTVSRPQTDRMSEVRFGFAGAQAAIFLLRTAGAPSVLNHLGWW